MSESDQSAFLGDYMDLIRRLPYVTLATYYEIADLGAADDRTNRYGVIRNDGSRKPAFAAFSTAAHDLRSGPAAQQR